MKKNILIIFSINILFFSFFLPQIALAQELPSPPATIEDVKAFGLKIINALPRAMLSVWQEQAMPILRSLWSLTQKPLQGAWDQILRIFENELGKRKPDIEKEFQKEKEEIKSDIPNTIDASRSFLERFRELLK